MVGCVGQATRGVMTAGTRRPLLRAAWLPTQESPPSVGEWGMSYRCADLSLPCPICNTIFHPWFIGGVYSRYCSHPCSVIARSAALPSLESRLWSHISRCPHGPCLYCCWEWTSARTRKGYGSLGDHGKDYRAHRLAYAFHNGKILTSFEHVCHHCDNPPCCNPWHLFLGTHLHNMQDMAQKGRQQKGELHAHAKLSTKQVVEIRALLAQGIGQRIIAEQFHVTRSNISAIHCERSRRLG